MIVKRTNQPAPITIDEFLTRHNITVIVVDCKEAGDGTKHYTATFQTHKGYNVYQRGYHGHWIDTGIYKTEGYGVSEKKAICKLKKRLGRLYNIYVGHPWLFGKRIKVPTIRSKGCCT